MRGGSGACALLAITCAFPACAQIAQPEAFEGHPIVSVSFSPARQPLTAGELSRAVTLQPGEPYRAADLRATIKRLYDTGHYAYLEAAGEPVNGGVAITIRTTEQWFIGFLSIGGQVARPLSRGEIAGAAGLTLGQPFTDEALQAAVDRVRPLLAQNGFFEAKVSAQLTRDPLHQQVNIRLIVEPGRRARYRAPVVIGQPLLDPEEAADATGWRRFLLGWKSVSSSNTYRGLQRLRDRYEDKGRLMADISIAKMEYHPDTNTVTPVIEVQAGPKVDVSTEGANLSEKKLRRYVPVFAERAVYRDLLVEGARNLRDYFQLQGYFDAKVDYRIDRVAPGHDDIVFTIQPGVRQKLVHVGVEGNRYFSRQAIRERMLIQPAGWLWFDRGKYNEASARSDVEAITALYQANGFRDVQVRILTVKDYGGKRNQMAVLVRIDEGPQYVVSELTIDGMRQLERQRIEPSLSSAAGQPFSELNVALDRNHIVQTYNAAGFPDASFAWSMQPGASPHEVRVHYAITEGERRWVRNILIGGVQRTSPGLLNSAFVIHPGEPLSPPAMTATQQRLSNLGIFDMVNTAVQNPDGNAAEKYVLYQIREGARWHIAGGAGAEIARIGGSQTSLSGAAGEAGFSPRVSLDVTRSNVWGLGQTLRLGGRLSTLQQLAEVNYFMPRFRNREGRDVTLTALYDQSFNVRTFTSNRLQGQVQFAQRLSRASTVLWSFTYSRTRVSDLKINPLLVPVLSQPARIGLLSGNYIQDRRDDPLNPRRGIYNTLNLGVSSDIFGSQASFTRLLGTNATYYQAGRSYVLARRLQFGWIAPFAVEPGIDPDESIPLPERFFAGGSISNRGFPVNQAGPRDVVTGFPLGGNALLFHTTEFRFPVFGKIGGVLFHDMGNVYSTISNISFRVDQPSLTNFDYMVHAVGFGLRYSTPVGPLRVDLAYSINPPDFFGLEGTTQQLIEGTAPRVFTGINHFQFFIALGQAF